MTTKRSRSIASLLKRHIGVIQILAALTFFTQIPSFYGEDIVNARDNFQTGPRVDFWGGMSTLVYAHIPNLGFRWQIWIAIIQISLTALGLNKMITTKGQPIGIRIVMITFIYSSLLFGAQMTRDGFMFSLLVFGFGTLAGLLSKDNSRLLIIGPLVVIAVAMSFRPWLSLAIIPLILLLFKNSKLKIKKVAAFLICISIGVGPIAIELTTAKALNLKNSFPEQQVMLMDIAATYCYSTNFKTGSKAKEALTNFSTDPTYIESACQLYRPDTWVSLTQDIYPSSQGINVNFNLIRPGEEDKYQNLKNSWIEIITSDPVTYLQNKILFFSKLLIGSDTRGLGFFSADSVYSKVMTFYRIPFDIAITLHLYSLIATLAIFFVFPLRRYVEKRESGVVLHQQVIIMISVITLWGVLSAVAYIGSNGRYTYAVTMLTVIMYLSSLARKVSSSQND